MSQRRGFCLNATTMGLETPKPKFSSPRGAGPAERPHQSSPRAQDKTDEEELPHSARQSTPAEVHEEQLQVPPEQLQEPPEQLQIQRAGASNVDASAATTGIAAICHEQCTVGSDATSTDHYRKRLNSMRDICGDSAMMNYELNNIFVKRLEQIDCMDQQSGGDSSNVTPQLRLATFQDWVDLLLNVNYVIVGNMSSMEMEAYEKMLKCYQSVRGEQQQAVEENRKLRKDMCAIIKLVQEAFHHNNWKTDGICLETMTVNQLLGTQETHSLPESESEKVNKCVASLASEMAVKHDEVCRLQHQICALDEVVETARQKLILKDQCIAQLNQQLMEQQDCLSKLTKDTKESRPADNSRDYNEDLDINNCLFNSLNEKDQQASELLRMLNYELTEFIHLISKKDFQAMECRRKVLSCYFESMNSDRAETTRKLDNLRSQLRSLDLNLEPLACSTQVGEDDGILIDALYHRLRSLNESNKELNSRCHGLDAKYKVQLLELQCTYEAERSINAKNNEALRQIAELLSRLRLIDISYEEIYTNPNAQNPFCVAIKEMYEKLHELENDKSKEELVFANDRLKFQLQSLKTTLAERDQQLDQQRLLISGYAEYNETSRLRDEIAALKQKNAEQAHKVCDIAKLLKTQEEERQKLCNNYENLFGTSEEQCKQLKKANREVKGLQERLSQVEKLQEELKAERNLLHEEVVSLKQKEASVSGRDRALNNQLRSRDQDLEKSRGLLREMECHLKQEERQHKDIVKRLTRANEDIRSQMRSVVCECTQMQEKLKQQEQVSEQQELIIDSFRKWKDAQIRSDEAVRQCMKGAEDHISLLVKENHGLCEEYRRLYGDYCLLETEMKRVKNAVNNRLTPSSYDQPERPFRGGAEMRDEMDERMKMICSTSERLAEQYNRLKEDTLNLRLLQTERRAQTSEQRTGTPSEQKSHPSHATPSTNSPR